MAPLFLIVLFVGFSFFSLFLFSLLCFRHSFWKVQTFSLLYHWTHFASNWNVQHIQSEPLSFHVRQLLCVNNFRFSKIDGELLWPISHIAKRNKIMMLYCPIPIDVKKRCSMDGNNKQMLTSVVIFRMSLNNHWALRRSDVAVHRTVTISSSNDFRNGIFFLLLCIHLSIRLVHWNQHDKAWWTMNRFRGGFLTVHFLECLQPFHNMTALIPSIDYIFSSLYCLLSLSLWLIQASTMIFFGAMHITFVAVAVVAVDSVSFESVIYLKH